MGNACSTCTGEATIDASKEEVNVSDKNLTSIAFKNLDNARIVRLTLSFNQLTSLPVEIGMLTGLIKLHLSGNQLTSLPVEIGMLTVLRQLLLSGNPLTTPPMEVCEEGITAIRAYFLEHQTKSRPAKSAAKTMQPVASEEAVDGGLPSYAEAVDSDQN